MKDLPEDRLASHDEKGWRNYIHPKAIKGVFQRRKRVVQWALLVWFLLLPWIVIDGRQWVLLDIPHRRFTLFGLQFWAHDVPMLFFVFALLALTILLFTSLVGRVWCGWACPQTVFIERIFRVIETWVEGDSIKRRELDHAPMSWNKFGKRSLKWFLYILAALVVTHSGLAYFMGSREIFHIVTHPPSEHPLAFGIVMFATAVVLFDFGWFREQFCIIMCPYGRFQSILMDNNSVNVAYDAKRGEPRKGIAKPGEKQGDCINCFRCVQVCPTGIDIRRGTQLECIACTACIDACDEVMERTHKPKGLIRYASNQELKGNKTRFIRPRTILYGILLTAAAITLSVLVSHRKPIELNVLRAKDIPYQQVQGKVLNHFRVDISNKTFESAFVRIRLPETEANRGLSMTATQTEWTLEGGTHVRQDLFILFDPALLKEGKATSSLCLDTSSQGQCEIQGELTLVGPLTL